ncbi:soluble lytic murein transglycosylase C precursor [Sulfurimonas gotlandica GD1]|uniref:Soluble lytic murein transglycosylase C n=1 Tax=Sulfurimonas gotlandica (strain DSM 19862 / JCM 16533 / GD1) TaxID=929558 RepID=B6BLL1_SULGG|nr:murein transglycosylase domain-containing protein [Sulfurimonas gotlandica]EDZ61976.1 membrane-bound lytic murein transglycosylase C, putative [Sulfurimonas gotlandica GD1]EHP28668.1 soluble lytic murein transglycosylase C precursor [Sulfurimonas gotlandica GD1]
MIKNLFLVACISSTIFAQSAQDFKNQQMQGFNQEKKQFGIYKKSQEEEFNAYYEEQNKAYKAYKKELGVFWDEPKISTKEKWVSYTEDKQTRTDVDFSKEIITLETIASSPEEAKQKLEMALAKVVTIDTKTVQETDPLEKKLSKIKKPFGVIDGEVEAEPILSTIVFQKQPTQKSVKAYVEKYVKYDNIKAKESTKVKHSKIYSLNVALPEDTMIKRSKIYYEEVKKNAKLQKLPMALVFAVMHTESSFNPRARSHIPAYGLMQIVPRTAGIDTYNFLYKKKKLVSGSYLYNSSNNIKMGSAYLHILYYKYLKDIKNPDTRLFCTIAAYNTGAGNIAWAFTRKYDMRKAAPLINTKSPEEVYNKLLKDLRYDEPKHYLKRVSQRMSAYYRLYGS